MATGLGLGLGEQGRDRGFSIATAPSRHWVATVGGVATGFGQGREVLCCDMETVSRQGTNPPLLRQRILYRDGELKKVYRDRKFRAATGLDAGVAERVATERLWRAT